MILDNSGVDDANNGLSSDEYNEGYEEGYSEGYDDGYIKGCKARTYEEDTNDT